MPVDLKNFTQLYHNFCRIDFTGTVSGIRPPLSTAPNIRAAISSGAPFLPPVYRQDFYQPLNDQLPQLLKKLQQEVKGGQKTRPQMVSNLESIYAPIYQHGTRLTAIDVRPELRRFLAVVSNLYRSFLDRDKRTAAGVKLVTDTPPLAFFQSDSAQGPYTIESDFMQEHFGVSIGIVSLPATYRDHPVSWAPLAHEVGGHDVVHADAGLIPELIAAVRAMFAPNFAPGKNMDPGTLHALIWSYWIDEAVADVYGVLNMGPIFPINLAAFLAAYRAGLQAASGNQPRPAKPEVSTTVESHGNDKLDEHPTDILRIYLTIGAIEAMTKLNAARRADYVASAEAIAKAVAGKASEISFEGLVDVGPNQQVPVKATMKLPELADAARRVGKMIATTRFKALNGHSIQEIETWDDADEEIAQAIAGRILKKQSIVGKGDDAQLLAGATLALLARPGLYDAAGSALNDALDDSFRTDPIWNSPATRPSAIKPPQPIVKPAPRKPAKPAAGKAKAGKPKPGKPGGKPPARGSKKRSR